MAATPVRVESADGVTVVRMDDGKVNALSRSFLAALAVATKDAVGRSRPVVLAGNGRAFSAGLDLTEVPALDREGLRDLLQRFKAAIAPVLSADVPVVAAVTGPAIAGGAIIALSCDHRVGAPTAPIGATELGIGIPFPPTDLSLFTTRLPAATIRRTIVQPRRVSGDEALAAGWLDEVAADPVAAAVEAAASLGGTNRAAYAAIKRELNRPVTEAWARFADEGIEPYLDLLTSKETQAAVVEGITRTLGRR